MTTDKRIEFSKVIDQAAVLIGSIGYINLCDQLMLIAADFRKPRLTKTGEELTANEYNQVVIAHHVGISSTGWRLVRDALVAAVMRRKVHHSDEQFVLSLWMRPVGNNVYFDGSLVEDRPDVK